MKYKMFDIRKRVIPLWIQCYIYIEDHMYSMHIINITISNNQIVLLMWISTGHHIIYEAVVTLVHMKVINEKPFLFLYQRGFLMVKIRQIP